VSKEEEKIFKKLIHPGIYILSLPVQHISRPVNPKLFVRMKANTLH